MSKLNDWLLKHQIQVTFWLGTILGYVVGAFIG